MMDPLLPVALETQAYRDNGTVIYYPQIVEHNDFLVEHKINRQIEQTAFHLAAAQKMQQGFEIFDQMIGLYEIKTNERNVFSLTLTNYAIHAQAAHGLTLMTGLNFAVESGENWHLSKQFKSGSDYESRLTALVNQQIVERDMPVFDDPVTVSPNQDYYIADKAFVLFYQLYDISPYYIGLPKFPISVYDVEDLLADDSLLSRMLA